MKEEMFDRLLILQRNGDEDKLFYLKVNKTYLISTKKKCEVLESHCHERRDDDDDEGLHMFFLQRYIKQLPVVFFKIFI